MVCSYCLKAEAVVSRRCQACADYLDRLHSSDDLADRQYAAVLVLRAAIWFNARRGGGLRKAA